MIFGISCRPEHPRQLMANEKMKNTALFVASLLFSLFLAELALRAPAGDYEKWRLVFDPYDPLGEAAQDYWADKILASGILKTR